MAETEKVTQADVDDAVAALKVGETRLGELQEAFYEGSGSWDDVKAQAAVIEYAQADIVRLQRAKRRYDEQVRQVELRKLKAEMLKAETAEGPALVKLAKAFTDAAVEFASAYKTHNDRVAGWRDRAQDLDVGTMTGASLRPSSDDAGVALSPHFGSWVVRADNRAFRWVYPGLYLQSLLSGLAGTDGMDHRYFRNENLTGSLPTIDETLRQVEAVNQELPPLPEDTLFYRNSAGHVSTKGPAAPWSAEELKRLELTPISRAEALGEDA